MLPVVGSFSIPPTRMHVWEYQRFALAVSQLRLRSLPRPSLVVTNSISRAMLFHPWPLLPTELKLIVLEYALAKS